MLTEGEGLVPLASLNYLIQISCFSIEKFIHLFTVQATLLRRSTVLSLPLKLVFPGQVLPGPRLFLCIEYNVL